METCICDKDQSKTNRRFGISVDSREQKILNILSESDERFKDLKSKTSLHQETLSRILDRLEERLIIRKDDKIYKPCCNGYELIDLSKNKR